MSRRQDSRPVYEPVHEVEHDGTTGVCDFEISTNPRQGTGPILASLNANVVEGLTTW